MTWMPNQQFLDLARSAAKSAAPSNAVGDFIEIIDEGDETYTYLFASKQKGYVGWRWSVTIYQGLEQPTVSEILLVPGPDSLVAPNWVPWSERLADWKALQAELERQAAEEAEDADDDEDSDEDAEDEDVEADETDVEDANDEDSRDNSAENTDDEFDSQTDSEIKSASDPATGQDDLAVADLEPGENAEANSRKTRKRIPSFIRRKLRGGKGENGD